MSDEVKTSIHRTQIIRMDGMSLQLGVSVEYRLHGFPFRVLACRTGVLIEGKSPWLTNAVFEHVDNLLQRARLQHVHLARFPIGEPQTALSEQELEMLTTPEEFQNGPRLIKTT